jgi:hypothetical protein
VKNKQTEIQNRRNKKTMKKMKMIGKVLAGLIAVSAMQSANAQLVMATSGGPLVMPGAVAGTGADGGTAIATLSTPFTFGVAGADTGTITTTVYTGDAFNALGGLTFIYTISITGGDVATAQMLGTWGATVGLGYGSAGAPVSGFGSLSPGNVNFGVGTTLAVNTLYLVVGTAGTIYAPSTATLIDSGDSAPLGIYAPSVVPEPTTLIAGLFLMLPLGASTARMIRKNRAA